MVLEAVMIVVDNSESSRNGDYQPTRFEAQADAVNIIFQSIVQGNPESSVGLMSMGGKGAEVLVTLTTDPGKILDGLHRTKRQINGKSNLATGIQIAGLALKHRQNKSQRQRIIVFICSPVEEEEQRLVALAKKMKKSNITIDFVLFGDLDDEATQKKLEAFNKAVKAGEGSYFVTIPPSSKLLSDQLIATPIISGDNPPPAASGGMGGAGGDEFDFDPDMEPELALAIRMSLEEERARQEKAAKEEEEKAKKESLSAVPEEGEASGSGDKASGKKDDKKDGGDDKMDIS